MAIPGTSPVKSAEEQHLLQVIFDRFEQTGTWPLVDQLRYDMDQVDDDLDVIGVGERLDPGLGRVSIGYQGEAILTIHGVAVCRRSEGVLDDALATMRYAYQRYRESGSAAELTSGGLTDHLGMGPLRVRRTYEVIHWLPGLGGGSGDGADAWSRQITADVIRYKRVETVAQLLAASPRFRRPEAPAPVPTAWTWPVMPMAASGALQELGEHVSREVQRMTANLESDPAAAITAARSLIEAVCKEALAELGQPVPVNDDLAALYRTTARALAIDPSQHEALDRQVLQGLVSAVDGLGRLRNRLGSAHGRSRSEPHAETRDARLAAGAAMTITVFLVEALEARGRPVYRVDEPDPSDRGAD